MMNQQLTLALSKGRIFDETLPLLRAAGLIIDEDPETSRKLILQPNDPAVRVIIVRASDVPTYVQYGAADFGVAGKDVLLEHGGEARSAPPRSRSPQEPRSVRRRTSRTFTRA